MPVHDSRPLARLLPHLASLLVEVPLDAPVAVGLALPTTCDVATTAPPVEFFFRHLDCTDVVCALSGFVAPAHWDAFGVVAPGRRLLLDTPLANDLDEAVTVCTLVARDGLVVSEVRTHAGEILSQGPGSGRAIDACRRVLALDTAPPLLAPHVWRTLRWVDQVLAAVLEADLGDPPPWSALAALRGLEGREHAWSWRALRTACARAEVHVPGIVADAARWMDDGLFAREAVAAFPPLADSLGDLRQLLPPHTFDSVIEHVSEQLAA